MRRREFRLSRRLASRLAAASSSVNLRNVTLCPSFLSSRDWGVEAAWRRSLDTGLGGAEPLGIIEGMLWWAGGAGGASEFFPLPWSPGYGEMIDSPCGGRVDSVVDVISVTVLDPSRLFGG